MLKKHIHEQKDQNQTIFFMVLDQHTTGESQIANQSLITIPNSKRDQNWGIQCESGWMGTY
jgi:hypothetical protein